MSPVPTGPVDRSLLPRTARIDNDGCLSIGGCDLIELVAAHGTPLFVYDEAHLRSVCREAVEAWGDGVAYATKAFLCVAMARLAHEEGMCLDVSTGGELHVALIAGVPADRLVLHGNNKSTTIRPTPTARAAASSSVDLLFPWSTIRSAGTPAVRATCNSPPVETSRHIPSS